MQTRTLEPAPPRASGEVAAWVEIAGWMLAFALLLAAPCAPERPRSGAAGLERAPISAPRGDARPPR